MIERALICLAIGAVGAVIWELVMWYERKNPWHIKPDCYLDSPLWRFKK